MQLASQKIQFKKSFIHPGEPICPECGYRMSEVDRVTENAVSFIWYECSQEGCDGQWLEKRNVPLGAAS